MFVVVVLLPTICVGHKLNMEVLLMCIINKVRFPLFQKLVIRVIQS